MNPITVLFPIVGVGLIVFAFWRLRSLRRIGPVDATGRPWIVSFIVPMGIGMGLVCAVIVSLVYSSS